MRFHLSKFLVIDYIHSTQVIKPIASKKVSHVTGSLTLINCRESTCHLTPDKTPDPKLQVASLLWNNEPRTEASATAYNSIIVQGMKKKIHILSAYQEKFREGYLDLIITKKKGKTVDKIIVDSYLYETQSQLIILS
jgi:hypothetical protein